MQEFEEKRGDREIDNLFAAAQNVAEVKDTSVAKCRAVSEVQLPVLKSVLADTLKQCAEAVARKPDPELEVQLEANRRSREIIWEQFSDDMNHKFMRLNNTFEEKKEELRDLFSDLERKLHNH